MRQRRASDGLCARHPLSGRFAHPAGLDSPPWPGMALNAEVGRGDERADFVQRPEVGDVAVLVAALPEPPRSARWGGRFVAPTRTRRAG